MKTKGWMTGGLWACALLGCGGGGGGFSVLTYNTGLARGLVSYTDQRGPEVARALGRSGAELACLQEVWESPERDQILAATGKQLPHALVPEPLSDASDAEPACSAAERALVLACVEPACGAVPADQLSGCVVEHCAELTAQVSARCQSCLFINVGKSIWEIDQGCAYGGGTKRYGGSYGLMLLSQAPLLEQDRIELDSTLLRRAVLYAKLEVPRLGKVHVFCTHLSSLFSEVLPYPGDYGSWNEENAREIEQFLQFVGSKVGGVEDELVLSMGDMNCGPDPDLVPVSALHFDALRAAMDGEFSLEKPGERCTYCRDNALVPAWEAPGTIDHIFYRNFQAGGEVQRAFTAPVGLSIDGETLRLPLSDHYGVQVELPCAH